MNGPPDFLAKLLCDHVAWPTTARGWEALLGQARCASLSARLGDKLAKEIAAGQLPAAMPAGAAALLQASQKVASGVASGMALEVERVERCLRPHRLRCVLLKGAAYLCAGLPPARGRVFGDIDLIVPKADLAAAESALKGGGWISSNFGLYHQRYYRQWMHEIPPLVHVRRGSVLDLHHTITPPTSVFHVDGAKLLAAIRPVGPAQRLWVLQPVDMVLHSAVHLFAEGEFDHGLRDLLDMADLLRHFESSEPGFWHALLARARELRLTVPLHHALTHIERLFGPRVPPAQRAAAQAQRPPWHRRWMMGWLLRVALRPRHPSCRSLDDGLARWLLYVRAHWLRMPLRLLLPHLLRKAWQRRYGPEHGGPVARIGP